MNTKNPAPKLLLGLPLGLAVAVALLSTPLPAHAGRNCDETPPSADQTQKAIRLARQVREVLESNHVSVAALGRIGSDQSKRGFRYTHVGYLVRHHPAGQWTVVHELNHCGSGSSELFDEGLANFYMDDPFDYETSIIIPSPAMQDKLRKILLGPAKRALHEPIYSSIANPWATNYQNSNGWVLEMFAVAAAEPNGVNSRAQAQTWLREHDYRPSQIHIGGGERAGARLFTPNIRFGDHPDTAWETQTYEVNTGDSTLDFLRRVDPASRKFVLRLDDPTVASEEQSVGAARVADARETRQVAASPVAVALPSVSSTPPAGQPSSPQPSIQPARGASAPKGTPPSPVPGAFVDTSMPRAQLLQSIQGLVASYACRPQGYLRQCRQIERSPCESQVSEAVLRCFATVSDQQLAGASEQAAMQQILEIGYCAVENVDAGAGKQPARTASGQECPKVRDYR